MPIELYTLALVSIFVPALCFVFYLYHKAHGRDVDAVRTGGDLVMDALQRNGTIMSPDTEVEITKAFNYEDDPDEDQVLPVETGYDRMVENIEKRSQELADQMAEKQVGEIMDKMDQHEKI